MSPISFTTQYPGIYSPFELEQTFPREIFVKHSGVSHFLIRNSMSYDFNNSAVPDQSKSSTDLSGRPNPNNVLRVGLHDGDLKRTLLVTAFLFSDAFILVFG